MTFTVRVPVQTCTTAETFLNMVPTEIKMFK